MYIPTKYGRILYVSKEGNNSSAEVGNISRPYEDPWAAADAASNGDTIYVFPGTWTIGAVGDGADLELSATPLVSELSLMEGKTDLHVHFENGSRIQVLSTAPNAWSEQIGIFHDGGSSKTMRVTGELIYECDAWVPLVFQEVNTSNIELEIKGLEGTAAVPPINLE